jgi:hypothetical protein
MLESNFEYGPPETSERYISYPATADGLGVQVSDTEWETTWEEVAAPSPESEIVVGEFVALLVTETVPGKLPEAAGENVASSVADCPGDRIKPAETPLTE